MSMIELFRERAAQKIDENVPLAFGELSALIAARVYSGAKAVVYVATPSELIKERVTHWAKSEGLHVAEYEDMSETVLCISWGGVCEPKFQVDGRFQHDGKLVLLNAH